MPIIFDDAANGQQTNEQPTAGPSETPAKRAAHSVLASSKGATGATGEDAPIAADCLSAPISAVCFHPMHILASWMDASKWSFSVGMDDGTGARWPLLLDSHAFRNI